MQHRILRTKDNVSHDHARKWCKSTNYGTYVSERILMKLRSNCHVRRSANICVLKFSMFWELFLHSTHPSLGNDPVFKWESLIFHLFSAHLEIYRFRGEHFTSAFTQCKQVQMFLNYLVQSCVDDFLIAEQRWSAWVMVSIILSVGIMKKNKKIWRLFSDYILSWLHVPNLE